MTSPEPVDRRACACGSEITPADEKLRAGFRRMVVSGRREAAGLPVAKVLMPKCARCEMQFYGRSKLRLRVLTPLHAAACAVARG